MYPVKVNVRLADYPAGSELAVAARDFNDDYGAFLALLTEAFNGQPSGCSTRCREMFRLRDGINRLVENPLPGRDGVHAAPTFEIGRVRNDARHEW